MHDDIPLTTGRARRVLDERITPAVHATATPLETAWHELPGEPIPPTEGLQLDFTPYEVGTTWGAAWGTTWFRLTGTVPDAWAGRRIEAVIDLGFDKNMPGFQCEGLVYLADGTPVKSINPRNQWVLVTERAEGGETVELFLRGENAAGASLANLVKFVVTTERLGQVPALADGTIAPVTVRLSTTAVTSPLASRLSSALSTFPSWSANVPALRLPCSPTSCAAVV